MFDFSKYKYISLMSSLAGMLIFFAITFIFHRGFAHSLDFNGGLRVTASFDTTVTRDKIEKFFKELNMEAIIIRLEDNSASKSKTNYQLDIDLNAVNKIKELNKSATPPPTNPADTSTTTAPKKVTDIDEFVILLKKNFNLKEEDILSADQVGAVVGGELTSTGTTLLLLTLLAITIYLSFRFEFKFALGASIALIHDLIFCIAFIGAFQIKPSVPVIAALLTILGYSINDTIVIFDRIRENTPDSVKISLSSIINSSINQTLSRTLNTSIATLVSVIALVIGGAVELYDFAYVLIFGVFIGTYSSIFIAAPIVEIYDHRFKPKAKSTAIKPEAVV